MLQLNSRTAQLLKESQAIIDESKKDDLKMEEVMKTLESTRATIAVTINYSLRLPDTNGKAVSRDCDLLAEAIEGGSSRKSSWMKLRGGAVPLSQIQLRGRSAMVSSGWRQRAGVE